MKTNVKTFFGAVLAGMLIGIGGVLYLSIENKVYGAFMFSVGLYAIVVNKLNLFTGKVGYIVFEKDKISYLKYLCIVWLGNLVGTFLTALLGIYGKFGNINEAVTPVINFKVTMLTTNMQYLFFLGIFCGLLMFIAVDGYKNTTNPLVVVMGVMAFILAGFEHCIADMFYIFAFIMVRKEMSFFTAAGILILVTLGNTLGGMLIPLYNSFIIEEKKNVKTKILSVFKKGKKKK